MAITLVGQGSLSGVTGASPQTITYTSTAGNFLAVIGHYYNFDNGASALPTGVTDSTGGTNTWHLSTSDTSASTSVPPTAQMVHSNSDISDFVAWSFTTAGVTSVTLTAASTFWRVTLAEYSGVGAFSSSWAGTANPAAATTFATGSFTIPQAGCLLLAAVDPLTGTITTPAGWSFFTAGSPGDLGSDDNSGSLPTSGSYSATWTSSVTNDFWAGAAALFTPASGPLVPAGNAPGTGAGENPATAVNIGMTIRGS